MDLDLFNSINTYISPKVYLSTRRGSWVLNRVSDDGMPADLLGNKRIVDVLRNLVGKLSSKRALLTRSVQTGLTPETTVEGEWGVKMSFVGCFCHT